MHIDLEGFPQGSMEKSGSGRVCIALSWLFGGVCTPWSIPHSAPAPPCAAKWWTSEDRVFQSSVSVGFQFSQWVSWWIFVGLSKRGARASTLGSIFYFSSMALVPLNSFAMVPASTRWPSLLGWDNIISFLCTYGLGLVAVHCPYKVLDWLTIPCLAS